MKRTSLARITYLSYLSQPRHERLLYRVINRLKADTVMEFGVGMGVRAQRLIKALVRNHEAENVRYVGVDLFEARPSDVPGMTLKRAHRLLSESGAQIRLLPGDPLSALARSANALTGTDVLVLGQQVDVAPLWFYLPRMMHEDSQLLLESGGETPRFEQLGLSEVQEKAAQAKKARAA